MRRQVLLQRANQVYEMRRKKFWRCINDMVVLPVTRLFQAKLESPAAYFLRGQLQRFEPGLPDIADEYECAVQCICKHRPPFAQMQKRFLPSGQPSLFSDSRPQRKKHPCSRIIRQLIHKTAFYPHCIR